MTVFVNLILESRSVLGGHAIEIDFDLNDKSLSTLQIPFPQIPILLRAIWQAAAIAETTQRRAAGEQMTAVVAPYQATDIRVGSSQEGTILADFSTVQGPMQIAMTADLARLTIERLSMAVTDLATRQFPRLS